jgi:predicted nucleic acid-binding protein
VTLVLDASVIVKWLLDDPGRESGTETATRIMESVANGSVSAVQPVHWLAEVAAVLARESPATAVNDVTMLLALDLTTASDPLILRRAVELSLALGQHVFDTLYHAVALETPGAMLVTADRRYLHAARSKGCVMDLHDWE